VTTAPRALPELDALRALAIAAVVALHVSFGVLLAAPAGSTAAAGALFVHLLAGYGAPLFVALSMAGLALGYERPPRTIGEHGAFLARRARRILPAYACWTLVTMLRNEPGALLQPEVVVERLVTGNAAYHLYFVPLICTYYLAWPLLAPLAAAARRSPLAAGGIAAGGLLGSIAVWHAASVGVLRAGLATLPLFWLGFAAVGIASAPLLARRAHAVPWPPIAALALIAAIVMIGHVQGLLGPAPNAAHIAIAVTIFQLPTLAYVLAAMALATALVLRSRNRIGLLAAFGRRAYGVYLVHVLVHEVVVRRVVGATTAAAAGSRSWAFAMVAEWAATLALAFAIVWSMERVPGLASFAGARPPSR
jgi:peptidoglycan/LPS O-acetylase OafA/YrhL